MNRTRASAALVCLLLVLVLVGLGFAQVTSARERSRVTGQTVLGWTPPQEANLMVRLEPGEGNFTVDGEGINTWTNLVAGGPDFTQSTGSKKPATATKNGLTVASFDGGDYLASDSGIACGAHTIVIALEVDSGSGDAIALELSDNPTAGEDDVYLFFEAAQTTHAVAFPQGGAVSIKRSSAGHRDDTWRIFSLVHNGTHASQETFINGADQNWTTLGGHNKNEGTTMDVETVYVGARGATDTSFLTGTVGAAYLYCGLVLSAEDRATVVTRANDLLAIY